MTELYCCRCDKVLGAQFRVKEINGVVLCFCNDECLNDYDAGQALLDPDWALSGRLLN